MSIIIPLTQGLTTIISEEDADLVNYSWCADISSDGHTYATRGLNRTKRVKLHRVIMARILGREVLGTENVDHIDRNGLNNSRSNLRLATTSQNGQNRGMQQNNTSKYKGVHYIKDEQRWMARIQVDKKRIYIGHYKDAISAAKAYNEAALRYHGEYASLNAIEDDLRGVS